MVYLVDDAADYRLLVQQVFRRFLPQYPLRLFADGSDLIQHVEELNRMASKERPRLIILDIDMPKLNGPKTLERLQDYANFRFIPVVMMSHRSEDSFISACYERGACSFLFKPMNMDQLNQRMSLLCQYWFDLNQLPHIAANRDEE